MSFEVVRSLIDSSGHSNNSAGRSTIDDHSAGYIDSELSTSAQSCLRGPGASFYSTQNVHNVIKYELAGKLDFDQPNVLHRLRIRDVDNELVKQIRQSLENDEGFMRSKNSLERLRELAEAKNEDTLKVENTADDDKAGDQKRGHEKEMTDMIFARIVGYVAVNDSRGAKQYDRKWLGTADRQLLGEGGTFSFPKIKPDFTLCDEYTEVASNKGKRDFEVLWRHQVAFVEIRATASQGPRPVKDSIVKDIVAQAAEYAMLHITCRPFLLFSIGLLIFGKHFCVAIFDRDGVQFSPIYDLWEDLETFIRIVRRMSHEMSPIDFGQDPNVRALPHNHPNSVICRDLAKGLAAGNPDLIESVSTYPTYCIYFCNVEYYTIGLPVWNSLSLLGRGTSIWRVTASPKLIEPTFLILKTAWRRNNRPSESAILQRVQGTHDGLVEYSDGSDVYFPSLNAITPLKITTTNLRNPVSRDVEADTTVLHRLIFKTVGRPIWEFNSYLEFFLAIKAALMAHKFLADQNILHRDISAGNVLLAWRPDEPDSKKGFLTDLEFARIDDKRLETKNIIPASSIPNSPRANQMTIPTWTPPPRGAVLTGTVQFMACELVSSFTVRNRPQPIHRVYHDVESFIWVMYYGILRRIGYVGRDLTTTAIPAELPKISQIAFQQLFADVDPQVIAEKRLNAPFSPHVFDHQETLWPLPIQEFFTNMRKLVITIRGRETTENPYGWGTHEELLAVLDTVIVNLRSPSPP